MSRLLFAHDLSMRSLSRGRGDSRNTYRHCRRLANEPITDHLAR